MVFAAGTRKRPRREAQLGRIRIVNVAWPEGTPPALAEKVDRHLKEAGVDTWIIRKWGAMSTVHPYTAVMVLFTEYHGALSVHFSKQELPSGDSGSDSVRIPYPLEIWTEPDVAASIANFIALSAILMVFDDVQEYPWWSKPSVKVKPFDIGDMQLLAADQTNLMNLTPRAFEHLVAELLELDGCVVELTSSTRDGGWDIWAWSQTPLGKMLTLVECKRWAAERRVSRPFVQALYGVVQDERANAGAIVTTSSFTADARRAAKRMGNQMALRDGSFLVDWVGKLAAKR